MASESRWHAVRVRQGRERAVAKKLERAGVAIYLPLIDRIGIVKSPVKAPRKLTLQWAMIPGYVFVYSLGLDWRDVYGLEDVIGVVIERGVPLALEDAFIQRLLDAEVDDAAKQLARVASRLASLEHAEHKPRKPGRRGKRGWRKRRR